MINFQFIFIKCTYLQYLVQCCICQIIEAIYTFDSAEHLQIIAVRNTIVFNSAYHVQIVKVRNTFVYYRIYLFPLLLKGKLLQEEDKNYFPIENIPVPSHVFVI